MISANTQVKLLLTCRLGASNNNDAKPFSVNEYAYFAVWLRQQQLKPGDLLNNVNLNHALNQWDQPSTHERAQQSITLHGLKKTVENMTAARIEQLLARGMTLSLALEQWHAAGIWILDREDTDYPASFKKHLKHQSPAILFGVGNKQLLSNKGIGFVGSRNVEPADISTTEGYVKQITGLGYQVVSGGAKGVDETAMSSALDNNNTAIGILAGDLLKSSSSTLWRAHLRNGKLALLSINEPDARFSPAAAMIRNKFIYLLSQACIVVRSDEKGGTWSGATDDLKKGWAPLLVSAHKTPNYAGNSKLLEGIKGQKIQAHELSTDTVTSLINDTTTTSSESRETIHVAEKSSSSDTDSEQLGLGFDD